MTWLATHLVAVATALATLAAAAVLVRQPRTPQATAAWLLAIVLVPYVGLPLFLALGSRKLRHAPLAFRPGGDRSASGTGADQTPAARLIASYGLPPPRPGHRLVPLADGQDAFAALLDLVRGAERSLWVELYVLKDDDAGGALLHALAEQAARGLDVRLLLDAAGSRPLARAALRPLLDAGGHVAWYEPALHRPFRGRTNLRNHRKLVLADGVRAWAGGMNAAHEYLGPAPDSARWRDLSFRLDGPACADYAAVFRSDWAWVTRSELPDLPAPAAAGPSTVQLVPSGPDVAGDALLDLLTHLAASAERRVWMVTPYFVPDESLARALAAAARRGVDVRLVVPDRSNQPFADLARGPALRALHAAGARIFRYPASMVHAKALVADGRALVGSANLDFRSLLLNAEAALLLYDAPDADAIATYIRRLEKDSIGGVPAVTPGRELAEGLVRLAAPLL